MDDETTPPAAEPPPPPPQAPPARFKAQTLNIMGVTVKVTGPGISADEVFVEPGPFSASVYVGAAARIARERALAALSGEPAPVRPRTREAAAVQTPARQRPARPAARPYPDDYVPPPVVPSARDMQRQQKEAADAVESGEEDVFDCPHCATPMPGYMQRCPNCQRSTIDRAALRRHDDDEGELEGQELDPVPVTAGSREPKAPIDRTFAQRRALQPSVAVGNSVTRVDLTDAFHAEAGRG